MAILFLDSSGLVKRYIAETGSAWVQSVTDPVSGNECYLAQITGAEVVSAITRRLRRGDLTPADASTALAGFETDFRQNMALLENSLPRIHDAMALIRRYG
ncbi:MAG: type II toxin-antitoxin system VapC family toxin, partial [Armatimonadota bacterium]|nr:type II toxin-antitoxin system VapC family toxin [Armatimonadota bacterium]